MPRVRVLCVLGLLAGGCGDGTGWLALSWRFADGRGCADSGASVVVVRGAPAPPGPEGGFACAAGLEPASVALDGVARSGADLTVEADSPQGAPLYRGGLSLDVLPPAATVTLYAAAAR